MYCQKCGYKLDPTIDRFCSKCGSKFNIEKSKQQPRREISDGCFIITIATLLILAAVGPIGYGWVLGDCGTLHVSRAIQTLEKYSEHITKLEDAAIDNVRPQSVLISQVDGDYIVLSNAEYDACIQPASKAMEISLMNASNFFGELPISSVSNDGYPIMIEGDMLQRKFQYEGSLRNYYKEIETLKACHPFCNLDDMLAPLNINN